MVFEVDIDCTACCSLLKHGNLLTKALTKREINEESLIKYLVVNCGNFSKVLDENVSERVNICDDINRFQFWSILLILGSKLSSSLLFKFKA